MDAQLTGMYTPKAVQWASRAGSLVVAVGVRVDHGDAVVLELSRSSSRRNLSSSR